MLRLQPKSCSEHCYASISLIVPASWWAGLLCSSHMTAAVVGATADIIHVGVYVDFEAELRGSRNTGGDGA